MFFITYLEECEEIYFLQPSWWTKPASWAVLRLFWITCVYIYIYNYVTRSGLMGIFVNSEIFTYSNGTLH